MEKKSSMFERFRKNAQRRTKKRGLRKQRTRNSRRGRVSSAMRGRMQSAASSWTPRLEKREEMPRTARVRRFRTRTLPVWATTARLRDLVMSGRVISLLILAGCMFTLINISRNDRFYLNTATVEGANYYSADQLLNETALKGAHITTVDVAAARESLLKLPGVVSAEIDLRWPGNAHITIEEETPIAIWVEQEVAYWVNSTGELIELVDPNVELFSIIAEVPAPAPITIPADLDEAEAAALQQLPNTYFPFVPNEVVQGALELQKLHPNLEAIVYRPIGGLTFFDEGGWTAHFGTGTDMALKTAIYNEIVSDLATKGIQPEYVNVSNSSRPVYKPAFVIPQPASGEG